MAKNLGTLLYNEQNNSVFLHTFFVINLTHLCPWFEGDYTKEDVTFQKHRKKISLLQLDANLIEGEPYNRLIGTPPPPPVVNCLDADLQFGNMVSGWIRFMTKTEAKNAEVNKKHWHLQYLPSLLKWGGSKRAQMYFPAIFFISVAVLIS